MAIRTKILLLVVLASQGAWAATWFEEAKQCNALPYSFSATANADFDGDVSYDIVQSGTSEKRSIRFSGDTIVLNSENFSTLMSSISTPITNIASLTIDARRIIVSGPITMARGKIAFLAEAVEFKPGAYISLTDPVAESDGLSITTRQLVLTSRVRFPFAVVPGKGTSDSEARVFDLSASTVTIDGKLLEPSEVYSKVWGRTLASAVTRKGELITKDFKVATGSAGEENWKKAFATDMVWPIYFAKKTLKFHSRSPFDIELQTKLIDLIQSHSLDFEQYSSLQPILMLRQVSQNIASGLDGQGYARNFVPPEQFKIQINRLSKAGREPGYLSYLEDIIISGSTVAPNREAATAPIREKVARLAGETATRESEVQIALATISGDESDISAFFQQYTNRRDLALQRLQVEAKTQAEKRKVVAAVHTVGTVVSLIPHPATQAAGLALNGAAAVIENEDGGAINVAGAIMTFEELQKKSTEFQAQVQNVTTKFTSMQQAKTEALAKIGDKSVTLKDKADKAKDLYSSAKAFGDAVDSTIKALPKAGEGPKLLLTDFEQRDEELKAIERKLESRRAAQAVKIAKLITLKDELQAAQNALIAAQSDEQAALAVDAPQNDVDRAKWRAIALGLWQSRIYEIFGDAVRLRRSYAYETGSALPLADDLLFFPDESIAYIKSGLLNLKDGVLSQNVDMLKKALNDNRVKFLTSATGIATAAQQGYLTYLNDRRSADQFLVQTVFDDSTNEGRNFLRGINRQIEDSIRTETAVSTNINLPMKFPANGSNRPVKYIGAMVTAVDFLQGTLRDHKLYFSVIHPGYGSIDRQGNCYLVDTRRKGGDAETVRTTEVPPLAHQPSTTDRDEIQQDVYGTRYYALPPAKAPYGMRLQVIKGTNDSPPRVTRVRVVISVIQ